MDTAIICPNCTSEAKRDDRTFCLFWAEYTSGELELWCLQARNDRRKFREIGTKEKEPGTDVA